MARKGAKGKERAKIMFHEVEVLTFFRESCVRNIV